MNTSLASVQLITQYSPKDYQFRNCFWASAFMLRLGFGSSGIIGVAVMPIIIAVNLNKIKLVSGLFGHVVV